MAEVTMRDLRNHGGDVVDRVQRGERLVVTRSGRPVAELIPVRGASMNARALLERWRQLPPIDADALRRDIDSVVDARL